MRKLFLVTDDLSRGKRLARDLGGSWSCQVHDLYADDPLDDQFEFIVSDIDTLTSDAVLRLRRALTRTRGEGVPYLFVAHDANTYRAEAHARGLGATGTIGADAMTHALMSALEGLRGRDQPVPALAVAHAGTARQFLADVFVPGIRMTPTVIDTGTGLISQAVRDVGVRDWISAVQRFDDATHQHCLLVAGLASAFAHQLGFVVEDCQLLTKAALLHDVGKIDVPKAILNKAGKLTPDERAEMEKHPSLGHAMLVGRGFEASVLTVVRSHHELLDGSGYPDRLPCADIPDMVRLVTICDIYAALIERRSYKAPMAGDAAFAVLSKMTGQLDADLVRAFRPITAALPAPPG